MSDRVIQICIFFATLTKERIFDCGKLVCTKFDFGAWKKERSRRLLLWLTSFSFLLCSSWWSVLLYNIFWRSSVWRRATANLVLNNLFVIIWLLTKVKLRRWMKRWMNEVSCMDFVADVWFGGKFFEYFFKDCVKSLKFKTRSVWFFWC